MREAAEKTQLIVATHCDRLISFLKLLVMDADEEGLTSWADDEAFENIGLKIIALMNAGVWVVWEDGRYENCFVS